MHTALRNRERSGDAACPGAPTPAPGLAAALLPAGARSKASDVSLSPVPGQLLSKRWREDVRSIMGGCAGGSGPQILFLSKGPTRREKKRDLPRGTAERKRLVLNTYWGGGRPVEITPLGAGGADSVERDDENE